MSPCADMVELAGWALMACAVVAAVVLVSRLAAALHHSLQQVQGEIVRRQQARFGSG